MKRLLLSPLIFTVALSWVALVTSNASAAVAQTVPTQITNSLAYPTSSQRFFQDGDDQLEIEIQRLQHNSQTTPSTLHISQEVWQQQQILQQQEPQLDEQLKEMIHRNSGTQELLLPAAEFR